MAKNKQRDPDMLTRIVYDMILSARLMFDRRVGSGAKLIPILMVLYILSPVDLIPEIAFGPFGLLDDITVLLVGLQLFIRSVPPGVLDEYRNGKPERQEIPKPRRAPRAEFDNYDDSDEVPVVLDGDYDVRRQD